MNCLQCNAHTSNEKFCSIKCSAGYNNCRRGPIVALLKENVCFVCSAKTMSGKRASKVLCTNCRHQPKKQLKKQLRKQKSLFCERCVLVAVRTKKARFCDNCRHIRRVECGLRSASVQAERRRSWSEKKLADLCCVSFSTVTHNERLFLDKNGNFWDADILIYDIKLAILWNGPWHYQKCTKRHSVAQVQARDKIKAECIGRAGWRLLIVEDRKGKQDQTLVDLAFAAVASLKNSFILRF